MMPLKNSQRITPNNLISGHLNGFKPYHHWEVLQKSTVTRSKSLAGSVSNGSQSALPVPLFFFLVARHEHRSFQDGGLSGWVGGLTREI